LLIDRAMKIRLGLLAVLSAVTAGTLFLGCDRTQTSADVLATVNGEKITRAEVEKYYEAQTQGSPQGPAQTPSAEQAASLRLSILKQLIDDEIILQRAKKLNLVSTEEEVEAKFNEFKQPYTQEEFDKRLKDSHMTVEELKRNLRKSLTLEKVINKEITSKINITDADISDYYNEHKAEFNLIEPQFHLAQIVVTAMPAPQAGNLKNDKAQNEAEARKKVQMLMNRLDSGDDFATVAMNYSEQPATSGNGGDMGFIPESSLRQEPQIMEMLSRLKAGQHTPPIAVVDPGSRKAVGWRILKLIAREPAGQRDLNDPRVQTAIRQQLRERREQLLKAAYYEVVRNETKVQNFLAEEMLKTSGMSK
jgi:peptidyl-prolyl cis-trans isomerase SurA